VITTKWILDQEMSSLQREIVGEIVADRCGLGRTSQMLTFLTAAVQRDEASLALHELHEIYSLTLIIASRHSDAGPEDHGCGTCVGLFKLSGQSNK
jgi:hypothetical protein